MKAVEEKVNQESPKGVRTVTVCLLSGGIDSTVAATLAAADAQTDVYLLSVLYGQGAMEAEATHSALVADRLMSTFPNVREHFVLRVEGGARTSNAPVRQRVWSEGFVGWRSPRAGWEQSGYPSTRDEVFTLIAAAGAEARLQDDPAAASADVVLSTNKDDLENFGDLRASNFLRHLQSILDGKLVPASGREIRIRLPLIELHKHEIVKLGKEIGAPLDLTWSCYFGTSGNVCGGCDQCRWRASAFRMAGLSDTTTRIEARIQKEDCND